MYEMTQPERDPGGVWARLRRCAAVGSGGGASLLKHLLSVLIQRQIKVKEIKYDVLARYTILICKALMCRAVTYNSDSNYIKRHEHCISVA